MTKPELLGKIDEAVVNYRQTHFNNKLDSVVWKVIENLEPQEVFKIINISAAWI